MFEGSGVAIVTPFKSGKLDLDKLGELIERQIEAKTDVIVPVGTTGESATLSHEEHDEVVAFTVKTVNGRAKVLAGAGSNSTREAVRLTRAAEKAGADGALSLAPYYNKPTQEGIYRHFKAAAESSGVPIVLYNVPGRTASEIAVDTAARLSEVKNIMAIKEAGGSVMRASELVRTTGLTVLSGDDGLTLPMMAVGAKGVISVVANVAPADVKRMVDACAAGKFEEARALHFKMTPVVAELFRENNPMGVKTALRLMGLLNGEVRPPLCGLKPESEKRMEEALRAYGLVG